MNIYNLKELKPLSSVPNNSEKFKEWIKQEDVLPYLEKEPQDEYIIIYASLPYGYIHSVLLPEITLDKSVVDDLMKWSYDSSYSWSLNTSSSDVWIEEPLSSASSKTLTQGEQIVFSRSFSGKDSNTRYFELNQKISHILDIHYMDEYKAWCKIDEHGDIMEVVKILDTENSDIVCIKKSELIEYVSVQNQNIVRMYDFTRYQPDDFQSWGDERTHFNFGNEETIFGSLTIESDIGSYSRGFQVVDIKTTKESIISGIWGQADEEEKRYCTFIAQDWKNKKVAELSCNPRELANYFEPSSTLPFEITPVFFKPDVLLKYKTDRDKYQLDSRSIYCRDSWSLETFDINSANQLHTYLIYLSRLPYEEQLHWKQYNIKPKASISERAYRTDIQGEFFDKIDALDSLKHQLQKLHSSDINWWKLRDINAPYKVHYPYTNSRDEWSEEILNLDQLLVEGFEEKWLRKKAKELKIQIKDNFRALTLIEVILVHLDFEESHAKEIVASLKELHQLRSRLKGHTQGETASKLTKDALSTFASFKNHFEDLCQRCDESLEIITNAFKEIK